MKKEQDKVPENKEKEQSEEVSRRAFLVGTGTVIVGGAIGAGLLSSCGDGKEVTKTVVQTSTKTVPTTVTAAATTITQTVTSTVGGGATVTQTKTVTAGGGVEPWQEPEETHYFQLTFH